MKNLFAKLRDIINRIAPSQGNYSWVDKFRVSIGVGLTVLAISFLNHLWGDLTQEENMVTAVFGVSTFCIFLFPDSKSFTPLVLLEANLLAACVAFICVLAVPTIYLGIPLAVIGTIAGMYFLGCMHPPAAFLSLIIVIAGTSSYDFALHPILADSFVLAIASYVNKAIIERLKK
jgi:CBS domain-containing membrane protein